jgi:hypothetical protein
MASLVVKKADETTNITYDAKSPSGGDGRDAMWRQDTGAAAGLPVGMRASLKLRSVNNGPGSARKLIGLFKYPYAVQDTTTTKYSVTDTVEIEVRCTMPTAIPASVLSEGARQGMNCFAATLIKQAIEEGFAP